MDWESIRALPQYHPSNFHRINSRCFLLALCHTVATLSMQRNGSFSVVHSFLPSLPPPCTVCAVSYGPGVLMAGLMACGGSETVARPTRNGPPDQEWQSRPSSALYPPPPRPLQPRHEAVHCHCRGQADADTQYRDAAVPHSGPRGL